MGKILDEVQTLVDGMKRIGMKYEADNKLVPLSDNSMKKIIEQIEDKFGMPIIGGIAVARAVEKAHGIE